MRQFKRTVSQKNVSALHEFCVKNKLDKFFLAKDDGAFIGQVASDGSKCIIHFKGFDPGETEAQQDHLGGDDFVMYLPITMLAFDKAVTFYFKKNGDILV